LVEIVGGGGEWPTARNYSALFRSSDFANMAERAADWEVRETRWFSTDALPSETEPFIRYCVQRAGRDRLCGPA
jgi:hypothetical protein